MVRFKSPYPTLLKQNVSFVFYKNNLQVYSKIHTNNKVLNVKFVCGIKYLRIIVDSHLNYKRI